MRKYLLPARAACHFDHDPFLVFKLRGLNKAELAGLMDDNRPKKTENYLPIKKQAVEALPIDSAMFWQRSDVENVATLEADIPANNAAWPKRLGKFPIWIGTEIFQVVLAEIYCRASPVGLDILLELWVEKESPKKL